MTEGFSRREREIMDVVFSLEEASANQVREAMDNPPSRTSVRTILRILVDKGHLTQRKQGRELLYKPIKTRKRAGQTAMRRVLDTFFGGSLEHAFAAHLADAEGELSEEELKRLAALIREARKNSEMER